MNRKSVVICAALIALYAFIPATARSQEAKLSQSTVKTSLSSAAGSSQPNTIPKEKIKYFDDGKIMKRNIYTPEGSPIEKYVYYHDGKIQKITRYDSAGKKIEESNYDNDEKLEANVDGWAAKRWTYVDGILRAESTYGEDAHLTERLIYNESGDLVDRQFIGDGDIDPNEEFNRGAVVTAETDQFFDKYGKSEGSVTTEIDDIDDWD